MTDDETTTVTFVLLSMVIGRFLWNETNPVGHSVKHGKESSRIAWFDDDVGPA